MEPKIECIPARQCGKRDFVTDRIKQYTILHFNDDAFKEYQRACRLMVENSYYGLFEPIPYCAPVVPDEVVEKVKEEFKVNLKDFVNNLKDFVNKEREDKLIERIIDKVYGGK